MEFGDLSEKDLAYRIFRFALFLSVILVCIGLLMIAFVLPTLGSVSCRDIIFLGLFVIYVTPMAMLFVLSIYYLSNRNKLAIVSLPTFVMILIIFLHSLKLL